jgi:hypothetical protein
MMPTYIFNLREREILLSLIEHAQTAGKICYSLGITAQEIERLRKHIDDPFKKGRQP